MKDLSFWNRSCSFILLMVCQEVFYTLIYSPWPTIAFDVSLKCRCTVKWHLKVIILQMHKSTNINPNSFNAEVPSLKWIWRKRAHQIDTLIIRITILTNKIEKKYIYTVERRLQSFIDQTHLYTSSPIWGYSRSYS